MAQWFNSSWTGLVGDRAQERPRKMVPSEEGKGRAGALSIGRFEGSRWHLRRTRQLWDLNRACGCSGYRASQVAEKPLRYGACCCHLTSGALWGSCSDLSRGILGRETSAKLLREPAASCSGVSLSIRIMDPPHAAGACRPLLLPHLFRNQFKYRRNPFRRRCLLHAEDWIHRYLRSVNRFVKSGSAR